MIRGPLADPLGHAQAGEVELNTFLNAVCSSGKVDLDTVGFNSSHPGDDVNSCALKVHDSQHSHIGASQFKSAGSYVGESNPTDHDSQAELSCTSNGILPTRKDELVQCAVIAKPILSSIGNSLDLPSVPNQTPIVKRVGQLKLKKPRKLLRVGVKRKHGSGKLKKKTRELAEVSHSSNHLAPAPNPSKEDKKLPSLFLAGAVLCGGSISSGDIACCNNRFWALQDKAVARKVWENAKRLGVEGNFPDGNYIELIESGEKR